MNPRIKSVRATDDYALVLQFTDDTHGIYDCTPLLGFGVFKELSDKQYFKRVAVHNDTVAWPNGQDICPDTLYLDAVKFENAS